MADPTGNPSSLGLAGLELQLGPLKHFRTLRRHGAVLKFVGSPSSDLPEYVVKYPRRTDRHHEPIRAEFERYRDLRRRGPDLEGITYIKPLSYSEEKGFLILSYFPGEPLATWLGSRRGVHSGSAPLRNAHQAAARAGLWLAELQRGNEIQWRGPSFDHQLRAMLSLLGRRPPGKSGQGGLSSVARALERSAGRLSDDEKALFLQRSCGHGDFSAFNLLLDRDGIVCPFDPGPAFGTALPARDLVQFRLSLLYLAGRGVQRSRLLQEAWQCFWNAHIGASDAPRAAALWCVARLALWTVRYEELGRPRIPVPPAPGALLAEWDAFSARLRISRWLKRLAGRGDDLVSALGDLF